jgi:DNA-binding MarR family transcriptional regulator
MSEDETTTHRCLRGREVPIWLRLARIYQKIERANANQLRRFGLSHAQFDVLAHVGAVEGITQQELADHLLVTKGNVTQLVDRMERCGLLVRRQEGRANLLYLTPQGRALFDEVVPPHEEHIAQLFYGLTPDEQRELHTLLRRLDRSLS